MSKLDRTFIISDTHFEHKNIIAYRKRPFTDIDEMNKYIIQQWKKNIRSNDTVYFLGDLAYSRNLSIVSFWKNQLKGKICFIKGNHDKFEGCFEYKTVKWGNHEFMLKHDPDRKKFPFKWDGWLIHGHMHNKDLDNFPFINGVDKNINVGVELIGYTPLSVSKLLALDIDSIFVMKTIDSEIERW